MDGRLGRKQGVMWMTFAMATTVVALPFGYLSSFEAASSNIGMFDPSSDYLVGLGWALVILVAIAALPFSAQTKNVLLVLWIARISVTLGFMLYYEGHYGLDASRYFAWSQVQSDHWSDVGFGRGTANVVALAALHHWLMPESYHALKVSWAAVGLAGVYLFYRSACLYLGRKEPYILLLVGLFPSILFWGSILGKDPITLLGIGAFTLGLVGFYKKKTIFYLLLAVLGLALAAWLRSWLLFIFVIPLGILLLRRGVGLSRRILFAVIVIPAIVFGGAVFQERFQIETATELVERTDQLSQGWSWGGSVQEVGGFDSVGGMLIFLPLGAFTALFRPLPGEVLNPFGIMAGIENIFVLILLTRAVTSGRWQRLRDPILAWAACTLIIWAAIYGFVSFQNLGTAFRYKVQVMPILVLLCLALTAKDDTKLPAEARRPRKLGGSEF